MPTGDAIAATLGLLAALLFLVLLLSSGWED